MTISSNIYVTIKKYVIARQLQQAEQIKDLQTGEVFFGQPGDWQVQDQNGRIYLVLYHQFIQRYSPHNYQAFCQFQKRNMNYKKRGESLIQIKKQTMNELY